VSEKQPQDANLSNYINDGARAANLKRLASKAVSFRAGEVTTTKRRNCKTQRQNSLSLRRADCQSARKLKFRGLS